MIKNEGRSLFQFLRPWSGKGGRIAEEMYTRPPRPGERTGFSSQASGRLDKQKRDGAPVKGMSERDGATAVPYMSQLEGMPAYPSPPHAAAPAAHSRHSKSVSSDRGVELVDEMPRGSHDPIHDFQETTTASARVSQHKKQVSTLPLQMGSIPDLVERLASADTREAKDAVHTLSAMAVSSRRGNKAIAHTAATTSNLVNLLHSRDMKVQYEATGLLGLLASRNKIVQSEFLKAPESAHTLAGLLASPSARVQCETLTAIARLSAHCPANQEAFGSIPEVVPKVIAMLESADPKMQSAAAQAVQCIAARNATTQVQFTGSGVLPRLVSLLGSESASVQFEALSALEAVADGNPQIQTLVLSERAAFAQLLMLAESTVADVQLEAINALGILGGNAHNQMAIIQSEGTLQLLISLLLSSSHARTENKVASALNNAGMALSSPTDHFTNPTWSPLQSGASSPDTMPTCEIIEEDTVLRRHPLTSPHPFHCQTSSSESIQSGALRQSPSSESFGRDFMSSPSTSFNSSPSRARFPSSSSSSESFPTIPSSYAIYNPLFSSSASLPPSSFDPSVSPAHSTASTSSISFASLPRMLALPAASAKEAEIQVCTVATLRRLAANNSEAKHAMTAVEGLLTALVALLASTREEVRTEAANTLEMLALEEMEIQKMITSTVEEFIAGLALLLRSLDEEVQCEAASALGNFAHNSRKRQRVAASTAGVMVGLAGMLGSADETAQPPCVALVALQRLIVDNPGAQAELLSLEGILNNIAALLMTKYTPVQIWAAGLLVDLARDNAGAQRAIAQTEGLIKALLDIVEQEMFSVVEWALKAIKQISSEDIDAQRVIACSGFIPVLVSILDKADLQIGARQTEAATWTLAHLASQDADIRQAVASADAISVLKRLLPSEDVTTVTSVHEAAAHALEALALNSYNQMEIATHSTVLSLLRMLNLPVEKKGIRAREQAAWALHSLTEGNTDSQELVRRSGGVEQLRAILESPNLTDSTAQAVKQALANFQGPERNKSPESRRTWNARSQISVS